MKKILITCLLVLPLFATAQDLLSRRTLRGGLRRQESKLLEPLLPFSVAVEKAKANDPQGWYALAIHYAKGEEVQYDRNKACKFLKKAYDLNYSNAVFAVAMMLNADSFTLLGRQSIIICGAPPPISRYMGTTSFRAWDRMTTLLNTNSADVAKIRAEYERAFKLGVSAATNELARLERGVEAARIKQREVAEKAASRKRNSELANTLLGITPSEPHESTDALRKRLNDPDADYDDGRTFIWEAGGKKGLSLDVLIRVREDEGWHYIEKATITIDKDGKIIKVQGKPGVTEIRS